MSMTTGLCNLQARPVMQMYTLRNCFPLLRKLTKKRTVCKVISPAFFRYTCAFSLLAQVMGSFEKLSHHLCTVKIARVATHKRAKRQLKNSQKKKSQELNIW